MIKKQPADLICEMVSASENQAMMAPDERLLAASLDRSNIRSGGLLPKVIGKDPASVCHSKD